METTLATLHANLGPSGQRRVPLGELPRLQMPNLVSWGARDGVFLAARARDAVGRLRRGELALIPNCGHLPHVERPGEFGAVLGWFLDEHAPDARSNPVLGQAKGERMKLKAIEDQVVAVMGASSGIGREEASRFAGRGAKVVVSARNEGDLRFLVEEIRDKGGEATAVTAEVTDFGQVKTVAQRAVEE